MMWGGASCSARGTGKEAPPTPLLQAELRSPGLATLVKPSMSSKVLESRLSFDLSLKPSLQWEVDTPAVHRTLLGLHGCGPVPLKPSAPRAFTSLRAETR